MPDFRLQNLTPISGTRVDVTRDPGRGEYALVVDAGFGYGSFDAFERLRTSNPLTHIDHKSPQVSLNGISTTELTVNGSAVQFQSGTALHRLSVSGSDGDRTVFQTKRTAPYHPGKSQLILQTFRHHTSASNELRRTGYFNDTDGVFLELSGSTVNMVKRSSTGGFVDDNAIPQSSWNLDRLDGTGPSGITLDFLKTQIWMADLEWLGVGSIRTGFIVDGEMIHAHRFDHANKEELPYMGNPSLPLRWEIASHGAGSAGYLDAICGTVISEGGSGELDNIFTGDLGTTEKDIGGTLTPLITFRVGTNFIGTVKFERFNIQDAGGKRYRWALIKDATISDPEAASWVAPAGSIGEYDVSMTGSVSGGTVLASGYGGNTSGGTGNAQVGSEDVSSDKFPPIGKAVDGTADTLTLAVEVIDTPGSMNFLASVSWGDEY